MGSEFDLYRFENQLYSLRPSQETKLHDYPVNSYLNYLYFALSKKLSSALEKLIKRLTKNQYTKNEADIINSAAHYQNSAKKVPR